MTILQKSAWYNKELEVYIKFIREIQSHIEKFFCKLIQKSVSVLNENIRLLFLANWEVCINFLKATKK